MALMDRRVPPALLLAAVLAVDSYAETPPSPALLTPPVAGGAYAPRETLRIDLPEDLDVAALLRLQVELDGTDVTAMLSLVDGDFVYQPARPLEPGRHLLRLVQAGDQPRELQRWELRVAAAAAPEGAAAATDGTAIQRSEDWLRRTAFTHRGSLDAAHRTLDHQRRLARDRTFASGAGSLQAEAAGGPWSLDLRADYFLESDTDLSPTGEGLDLAEYNLRSRHRGETLATDLQLGHHSTGIDSLLFASRVRRGASLHLADARDHHGGGAFAFRSDGVAGAEDLSGLSTSDDLLRGVYATTRVGDGARLGAVYFSGSARNAGLGIAGAAGEAEGDGWTAIAELPLLAGRLSLRGEYARARYDGGGATPERDGRAVKLELQGRPFATPPTWGGQAVDLVAGIRRERIDTDFASLANPDLAADRDSTVLYATLVRAALSSTLSVSHETNNVDDVAGLPTDRLLGLEWDASYAFAPRTGSLAWLGTPYLQGALQLTEIDRDHTPAAYAGPDTRRGSRNLSLGGGASYGTWGWQLSHAVGRYYDNTGATEDTLSHLTSAGLNLRASDHFSLGATLQSGELHLDDSRQLERDTHLNLAADFALVPETLNLNASYAMALGRRAVGETNRHALQGELEWVTARATAERFGLALVLTAAAEDNRGSATPNDNDTSYQIYAGIRIVPPLGGQP